MAKATVSQELVLRVRAHAPQVGMNPTGYAAAKLLGVSQNRLSHWIHGRAGMNDEAIHAACELLWPGRADVLGYWLARRQAELAADSEREGWAVVVETLSKNAKVARALGRRAAAVALVVGAVGLAPAPQAATGGLSSVDSGTKYYVKSRRRRKAPQRAARRPLGHSHYVTA